MWRLLKAAVTTAALLVLIVVAVAWISLERAASTAAAGVLDSRFLAWGDVGARPLPPSARVEKPMLKRGLLSAESVRFLLLPGAWTKRGTPAGAPVFEKWLLELRLPRAAGCNCAAILDGRWKMPPWTRWRARDGRIELEAGPLAFEAVAVEASRSGTRLEVRGRIEERAEGELVLEGELADGFDGTLRAGPLDAAPRSAVLVDPPRGRVLGGSMTVDAKVTVRGSRILAIGTITTTGVAVERKPGEPTAVEAAIERGDARLAFRLDADVEHGADWAAVLRESLSP